VEEETGIQLATPPAFAAVNNNVMSSSACVHASRCRHSRQCCVAHTLSAPLLLLPPCRHYVTIFMRANVPQARRARCCFRCACHG
jgi:hypothetical protein